MEYSVVGKLLKNCIGESLQALGLFGEFFSMTPKSNPEKKNKQTIDWIFIKVVAKWAKDSYLEYIKDSQSQPQRITRCNY